MLGGFTIRAFNESLTMRLYLSGDLMSVVNSFPHDKKIEQCVQSVMSAGFHDPVIICYSEDGCLLISTQALRQDALWMLETAKGMVLQWP